MLLSKAKARFNPAFYFSQWPNKFLCKPHKLEMGSLALLLAFLPAINIYKHATFNLEIVFRLQD